MQCAQVLGILAFVGVDDIDEILSCMTAFDSIFGGSFLKGDKSIPIVTPAISDLHLNALSSWCLLLSVTPWCKVKDFAERCVLFCLFALQCLYKSTELVRILSFSWNQ